MLKFHINLFQSDVYCLLLHLNLTKIFKMNNIFRISNYILTFSGGSDGTPLLWYLFVIFGSILGQFFGRQWYKYEIFMITFCRTGGSKLTSFITEHCWMSRYFREIRCWNGTEQYYVQVALIYVFFYKKLAHKILTYQKVS